MPASRRLHRMTDTTTRDSLAHELAHILQQRGMTREGAAAAANGRAVFDPADRQLLADLVVSVVDSAHGVPTGDPDRPIIAGTIPNPTASGLPTGKRQWEILVLTKLQQSGFSSLGARQVVTAEIVTNPADRKLIAGIMQTGVRLEPLDNKYPENMKHRPYGH